MVTQCGEDLPKAAARFGIDNRATGRVGDGSRPSPDHLQSIDLENGSPHNSDLPTSAGVGGEHPNLSSVTGITGPLAFAANTTFPGSGNIEACFYSGGNCSAANGQATSFSGGFTLNFSGSSPFTLNDFVDRYASIAALNNQSGEGHPYIPGEINPLGGVPEPSTWAMMLLGFGGVGVAMRRGRKQTSLRQIA